MRIYINDTQTEVAAGASVKEVIESLGIDTNDGVAVALNQTVIYKPEWPNTILEQNDMLLIIKATKGG